MKRIHPLLRVLLLFSLGGCHASREEDLQGWMAHERQRAQPHLAPPAAPKPFSPEPYTQTAAIDPFAIQNLTQALKRESTQAGANGALVAPELVRRQDPLEAFALDSMALVGSMVKAGQTVALVRVDNVLYQVKPGDHLGLNFGRVLKISETEIRLREVVQDTAGVWIERSATLQLQERPQ